MPSPGVQSPTAWARSFFGNLSLRVFAGLITGGFCLRGFVYFVNAKAAAFTRRNGSSIKPGCRDEHVNAVKITRQSKSNLALAFISLGRERKRDINIFYAFCRVVDDIADSSELNVAEKRQRLAAWREMLRSTIPGEPAVAHEVRCLIDKYSLSIEMLDEIISVVY